MAKSTALKQKFNPPQQTHAASLNVFLSPVTFKPYDEWSRNPPNQRDDLQDIKLDVFLNGSLLSTRVILKESAKDEYLDSDLVVRMTGLPLDDQKEQALILVPPGQNPNGNLQEHKRKKETASHRWQEIAHKLVEERKTRLATGEDGVMTESLRSLAEVAMPKEVEHMCTANRTFSVLDVVVASGRLTRNANDESADVRKVRPKSRIPLDSQNPIQTEDAAVVSNAMVSISAGSGYCV